MVNERYVDFALTLYYLLKSSVVSSDFNSTRGFSKSIGTEWLALLKTRTPRNFAHLIEHVRIVDRLGVPPVAKLVASLEHFTYCDLCHENLTGPKHHSVCQDCHLRDKTIRINRGYSARDDRFEAKNGVRFPRQLASVNRKAIMNSRRKWGVDHPTQSEFVKQSIVSTMQSRHGDGVTNVMHLAESVRKLQQTNLDRWGTVCTLNAPVNILKKKATWVDHFGVDNPSRSLEVFRSKHQDKTIRIKLGGRSLKVLGTSEVEVAEYLFKKYPDIVTPYSQDYPVDTWYQVGGFPDFYSDSAEKYFECKSIWTFYAQRELRGFLAGNIRRASRQNGKVKWIIHLNYYGANSFIALPKDWHLQSPEDLIRKVHKTAQKFKSYALEQRTSQRC